MSSSNYDGFHSATAEIDTSVEIAGVLFKNPITAASGTCGFGTELARHIDVSKIGAIFLKGLTLEPRLGNPLPRVAETTAGMLNSVGLQNPGADVFINEILPQIKHLDTRLIANISGNTADEYCRLAEKLGNEVDMLEINVSCPNVKQGCMAFGTSASAVESLVCSIKKSTPLPIIVKLSPNVTDICEIAKAAEAGGADALSLINTLLGMRIDVRSRKIVLHNKVGGLSGPCIKPVAIRMVWQVCSCVEIPVIGLGGIMSGEDAAEFILAGASAVSVGTATLKNPRALINICSEFEDYLKSQGVSRVKDIIGGAV